MTKDVLKKGDSTLFYFSIIFNKHPTETMLCPRREKL